MVLIREYIHILTKVETQRQYLFQVVADHCKNFADAGKKIIVAGPTRSY